MNVLRRLAFGCVSAGILMLFAGCSGETKMAQGDPTAKIAPAATKKLPPKQGGPEKGSSAGMNFNPGGVNN